MFLFPKDMFKYICLSFLNRRPRHGSKTVEMPLSAAASQYSSSNLTKFHSFQPSAASLPPTLPCLLQGLQRFVVYGTEIIFKVHFPKAVRSSQPCLSQFRAASISYRVAQVNLTETLEPNQ